MATLRTRTYSGLAALAAALLLAGPALRPAAASGSGSGEAPAVTNLGLAHSGQVQVNAGFALFPVDELSQAFTDLNGDGDVSDAVFHVYDRATGATTNLGLAGGEAWFAGSAALLLISESGQGFADLNGDGDASDQVFHVHDFLAGTTTNLGLAGFQAKSDGGRLLLKVSEFFQGGADLNGDGDALDDVFHVYDPLAKSTWSSAFAVDVLTGAEIAQGVLALAVSELGQGAADLNGDGDTFDVVVHTIDLATGVATNHSLALVGPVLAGDENRFAFGVSELNQGGVDLNGDGDASDEVVHVLEPGAASPTNVGLAVFTSAYAAAGSRVVFLVSEWGEGFTDLNGDSDANDNVLHVYDPASGQVHNAGLDGTGFSVPEDPGGARVAFWVSEMNQGMTDLNGDGDTFDLVIHVHDAVAAQSTNLALAARSARWHSGRVAFGAEELNQGVDLNGDGDTNDRVVHVHDLALGVTTNLGLAASTLAIAGGEYPEKDVLFAASESGQGADLNGDGDTNDNVPVTYDPSTGAVASLGLSARLTLAYVDGNFEEMLYGLSVSEQGESVDLNGDGDLLDMVVHVAAPDQPRGLTTDADSLSVAAGGRQTFRLDAGHGLGGYLYWILGTTSGTAPGLSLGGLLVPLNPDFYFFLTLNQPNQPPLVDTFAALDGMGEAWAAFELPAALNPALAGVTVHHAYGAIDPATLAPELVSNPVPLALIP